MMAAKARGFMELRDNKELIESLIRTDRLPHVWCSGCGIGIVMSAYLHALVKEGIDPDRAVVVSGIGCSGRAAGYVRLDSFHTTHGRPIPFAVGLKLANPELNVTVFSGDGDLFSIGGNHILHAARRNNDITVICINNYNYGMTGGQGGPTTPEGAYTTTTPYGNYERPLNLPHLMISLEAPYVARWTVVHVRRLTESIREALTKKGFAFIEVLSPCPTAYGRRNAMRDPLELMRFFQENSVIKHDASFEEMAILPGKPIVVGKFRDVEGIKTYEERVEELIRRVNGA